MRPAKGFTLIELLIAVVIVSILAAIALPAYSRYVQSSRHAAAKSALSDVTAAEEKYYATNNVYTDSLANLGYATVSATCNGSVTSCLEIPSPDADYYAVSVTISNAGADFTAIAAPVGAQASDGCGTFQVTDQGDRTVSGSGDCW